MALPAYRRLYLSTLVVMFGTLGQAVARGWLAHELTGSNVGLGGVMMAFGVAMLVATPLGGVTADRYSRPMVMCWSVVALTVSSVAIGVLTVLDSVRYWELLVASAVQGAAFTFYLPARVSMIAELVPATMIQGAVVLAQMSQEALRVVAPALAGALIGVSWFGVGGLFLAAGVLSAVAAVAVATLPRSARRPSVRRSPLGDLVAAARYSRTVPGLRALAVLSVGVVMVGFPYMTFLPAIASDRFHRGPLGYGAMLAASGLGALAIGVLGSGIQRSDRPWLVVSTATAAFGVTVALVGVAGSFAVTLLVLPVVGATGLVFQTSVQALMLRISAMEYHGRMQSVVTLGFSGFGLAALPLGLLADRTSLTAVLAGQGALVVLMAAWFERARRRRAPAAITG